MARTLIPLTNLSKDGGIAAPAGTAVDPTNGHYVETVNMLQRLILFLHNTAGATKVVTVKAGPSGSGAYRGSIGDLAYTAQASGDSYMGPFVSARFMQSPGGTDGGNGGRIFIDLASGVTGTISALWLPHGLAT